MKYMKNTLVSVDDSFDVDIGANYFLAQEV